MVFFFKSRSMLSVTYIYGSDVYIAGHLVYMGRDKYENEDLIAYGWPEDVWFHVDEFSSAHVYTRLNNGETIDNMPQELIDDCCQLVKANSIEGCKASQVTIVYTPWDNLNKRPDMATGQIGFHDNKKVKHVFHLGRDRVVANRILKTKEERSVDLKAEKQQRDHEEMLRKKKELKERKIQERKENEEKRAKEYEQSYDRLFENDDLKTFTSEVEGSYDVSAARNFEDDFM
ncbi:hypothetical protein WA158_005651 [Blastocystis sp. Blastoise]